MKCKIYGNEMRCEKATTNSTHSLTYSKEKNQKVNNTPHTNGDKKSKSHNGPNDERTDGQTNDQINKKNE